MDFKFFEIVLRMKNVFSSPDGSQYPFGLAFSPKDMAYSGREVVVENGGCAPKKKPAFRPVYKIILIYKSKSCKIQFLRFF
jgi:hypothetical protein